MNQKWITTIEYDTDTEGKLCFFKVSQQGFTRLSLGPISEYEGVAVLKNFLGLLKFNGKDLSF